MVPARYDRAMVPVMPFPEMNQKNNETQGGLQNAPGALHNGIENDPHIEV